MSIIEILITKIGFAISKAALKLWLKDNIFGQEISLSIVEIINGKIEDVISQRKVNRFFDRISEKIAEEMKPYIELDFNDLSQINKKNIISAVSDTIDNTKLSSKILAAQDLDPQKLNKYIIENSSYIGNKLSKAEKEFFDFVLGECCSYIIEINSAMPDYYSTVTGELLKREAETIELINKIINNIPKSRIADSDIDKDTLFVTDYLRKISIKLDVLELIGINLYNIKPRYNLNTAFVNLFFEDELGTSNINIGEILDNNGRIVVRGEPGSGKTTLLKWIAVTSARNGFDENLKFLNEYIPFYLKLRSYPTGNLPNPQEFIDEIAGNIQGYMPQGWVHRVLETGKCFVLIDGVDEIPKKMREKVKKWIEDLTDEFPFPKYIVTSRPPAIPEQWLDEIDFQSFSIQPMNLTSAYLFIEHWHKAARNIFISHVNDDDIIFYKKKLKSLITDIPSLKSLSTNPLLCSLLCALNIDRKTKLPAGRMELYRIAIESLIERRDVERDVPVEYFPQLLRSEKEIFLRDYAYWLIKNSLSSSSYKDFLKRITKILKNMHHLNENPALVADYLIERSGILREPEYKRIDFLHKTFQEYLAAKAAILENDIGLLIEKSSEDQWHDVIIMAVGHSNKEQSSKIIKGILKNAEIDKVNERKLKCLSIACQETATQLNPNISILLEKTKEEIFPPKNFYEAKLLSAAGNLGVPYLSKYKNSDENVVIACIQALTMIGTEDALEALHYYSSDLRKPVFDAIIWSWDYFDQEKFANIVFCDCTFAGPLILKDKAKINGIDQLKYLKELSLLYCSDLDNISAISELHHLEKLEIDDCNNIKSFTYIEGLCELRSLIIISCDGLSSLFSFQKLRYLRELLVTNCNNLFDISNLSELTSLKSLSFQYCKRIEDISSISELTNLTMLNLEGCIEIVDISSIKNLVNLEELNIDGCYGIKSLSSLVNLTKLKRLFVPELGLADTLPNYLRYNIEIN